MQAFKRERNRKETDKPFEAWENARVYIHPFGSLLRLNEKLVCSAFNQCEPYRLFSLTRTLFRLLQVSQRHFYLQPHPLLQYLLLISIPNRDQLDVPSTNNSQRAARLSRGLDNMPF
jgi:hypothetical protein